MQTVSLDLPDPKTHVPLVPVPETEAPYPLQFERQIHPTSPALSTSVQTSKVCVL